MFLSSDQFVRQNSETHWKGEILKKMEFLMYFKYFSAITINDLFIKTIPGNKAWIINYALSIPRIPRNPETKMNIKWRFALEICVGCPVQLIREVFSRLHLRRRRRRHTFASLWGACSRFASLWRANTLGDSCVLGVHLSNVCWSLLFCRRKSFIFYKCAAFS